MGLSRSTQQCSSIKLRIMSEMCPIFNISSSVCSPRCRARKPIFRLSFLSRYTTIIAIRDRAGPSGKMIVVSLIVDLTCNPFLSVEKNPPKGYAIPASGAPGVPARACTCLCHPSSLRYVDEFIMGLPITTHPCCSDSPRRFPRRIARRLSGLTGRRGSLLPPPESSCSLRVPFLAIQQIEDASSEADSTF